MSGRYRRFSAEFKVEAAHRIIDTGGPVAEVSRELTLGDALLGEPWRLWKSSFRSPQ